MSVAQSALVFAVMAPGGMFCLLAFAWLAGWIPSERSLSRLTGATFMACVLAAALLLSTVATRSCSAVVVTFGNWFAVREYRFPLVLVADRLSLPFIVMTIALTGLIGQFSATYLHRESGFFRFFVLLHLFAFGSLLAFAAGSFDLLIAGWELVGITSVVLIAFFDQRAAPVENGLRVFAIYRSCDIGLLMAAFALHRWAGNTSFAGATARLTGGQAMVVCLLLLVAASGKAAQIPFSGWLPRAMEGPTPSSAIFYGAISIHAGAYLLLRVQPLLAESHLASSCVVVVGMATAIYGTITGRASADAKTSLAFASLSQVGVIFVEIGIGWKSIAVSHILGHALVRTLQFLRAPSMLHDYHRMQSAIGGKIVPKGKYFEDLLPDRARLWLYRWALDRGHLDTILDRWFVDPLLQLSRMFARLDGIGMRIGANPKQEKELSVSIRSAAGQAVE